MHNALSGVTPAYEQAVEVFAQRRVLGERGFHFLTDGSKYRAVREAVAELVDEHRLNKTAAGHSPTFLATDIQCRDVRGQALFQRAGMFRLRLGRFGAAARFVGGCALHGSDELLEAGNVGHGRRVWRLRFDASRRSPDRDGGCKGCSTFKSGGAA